MKFWHVEMRTEKLSAFGVNVMGGHGRKLGPPPNDIPIAVTIRTTAITITLLPQNRL
jgi:hypothetical protein